MSSSDIRRVGEAGVHTVEGNIAGSRAATLTKQRDQQAAEYEAQKQKIKHNSLTDLSRISSKFDAASIDPESEFQQQTIGLVSAEDFRKARERQQQTEREKREKHLLSTEKEEASRRQLEQEKADDREKKRRKLLSTLSFAQDDADEQDSNPLMKKKITKDPTVDTSFLPDAQRERELSLKREQLRDIWLQQQEVMKKEVSFSNAYFLLVPNMYLCGN
jgi:protein FAM50